MSTFPGSPRILKGGLVLLDPDTFTVLPNGIIVLQYNPDTLSRTLKIKGAEEGGDRSEALRLTGPPVETFKLDAEIDATDQLEVPDQNPNTVQNGIFPQLSALETIVYPASATLQNNFNLSQAGTLEIMPVLAPLTLFVWSANRIVPVRITDFSITEEAFDPALNPIRAKVSLGMRVLSIDDLYFNDKGGSLYMVYQQQKETLARMYQGGIVQRPRNSRYSMSNGIPTDPVQAMLAQTSLQRNLFTATSRYYGIDTETLVASDGTMIVYVKRRFLPSPDRFQLLAGTHGDSGRAAGQHRRQISWRSRTVLAPCRRQRRHAAGGTGRKPSDEKLQITLPEGITGSSL